MAVLLDVGSYSRKLQFNLSFSVIYSHFLKQGQISEKEEVKKKGNFATKLKTYSFKV